MRAHSAIGFGACRRVQCQVVAGVEVLPRHQDALGEMPRAVGPCRSSRAAPACSRADLRRRAPARVGRRPSLRASARAPRRSRATRWCRPASIAGRRQQACNAWPNSCSSVSSSSSAQALPLKLTTRRGRQAGRRSVDTLRNARPPHGCTCRRADRGRRTACRASRRSATSTTLKARASACHKVCGAARKTHAEQALGQREDELQAGLGREVGAKLLLVDTIRARRSALGVVAHVPALRCVVAGGASSQLRPPWPRAAGQVGASRSTTAPCTSPRKPRTWPRSAPCAGATRNRHTTSKPNSAAYSRRSWASCASVFRLSAPPWRISARHMRSRLPARVRLFEHRLGRRVVQAEQVAARASRGCALRQIEAARLPARLR